MYKTAARRQAFPCRASDEPEPRPVEYALIMWRAGRDNRGEWCVFRRVTVHKSERDMETWFSERFRRLGHNELTWRPVRVVRGVPVEADLERDSQIACLVEGWKRQRKGINRHADPWVASAYSVREAGGAATTLVQEINR